MKYVFYISVLSLLITLIACRKDKVPVPSVDSLDTCNCEPIPTLEGYNTGYNHVNDSIYFFSPRFNPNNDDEIIYVTYNQAQEKEIYKYNLLTESKTLLYQGQLFGTPDWGGNDQIVFTRGYQGVYQMNSDGSSLSLLIPGGVQFHPKFNATEDRILTYHGFQGEAFEAKIWDTQGALVDSLNYRIGGTASWNNQGNIASIVGSSLLIIDPESKNVIKEYNANLDFNDNGMINGFIWLNKDEALFTKGGLYKFNIWTGQKEELACGCSSKFYFNGDVNESGTKALVNKIEYEKIAPQTLKEKSSIVIYDVESNTFEEIDIQ